MEYLTERGEKLEIKLSLLNYYKSNYELQRIARNINYWNYSVIHWKKMKCQWKIQGNVSLLFPRKTGKWMNVFTYQIDLEALGSKRIHKRKKDMKTNLLQKGRRPKLLYSNYLLNLLRQWAKNETVIHPLLIS